MVASVEPKRKQKKRRMMNIGKVSNIKILAVLLLVLTSSTGCKGSIILNPIEKTDIFFVEKGTSFTSEKDGYFLSEFYLDEIVQAKVKQR